MARVIGEARAQLNLRSVQQHVDVATRDTERFGHVLARLLIEQPPGDDGLLRVAQPVDASTQPTMIVFRNGEPAA